MAAAIAAQTPDGEYLFTDAELTRLAMAEAQPKLEAAQVIERAVTEHKQQIELERRVLDFNTSPKRVDIDYDGLPLFGTAQKGLFE